jgi:hypothetical protein
LVSVIKKGVDFVMKRIEQYMLQRGAVFNSIVKHKTSGKQVVFFAVDYDSDTVLLGPTEGRRERSWFTKCWMLSSKKLCEEYEFM